MDLTLIAVLLLLGAGAGLAAGMLGIGGGMLLVPFLTLLLDWRGVAPGLVIHMAIGTSLATILFTSISSVRAHHKRGAVQWRIAFLLAPGILIGSWIGPWLGTQMHTRTLYFVIAGFVAFAALQMWANKKPAAARELPGPGGMLGAGGVIGVLSGLVGAGGGFVSVPFMTWCNVRIHHAVATSAALGFPIALSGTLSNIYHGFGAPQLPPGALGFIHVPALLVIALASVSTAPLGARIAHSLPVRKLQRVFVLVLLVLALYMFYKGIIG